MNKKGNKTTTDGLAWNTMLGFAVRLKNDGLLKDYLLITSGCYFGLRISDLLSLTWDKVLDKDEFNIREKKTGKTRRITINPYMKEVLVYVAQEFQRNETFLPEGYLFANRWGRPISVSYVNKRLKVLFKNYNIRVHNPSSHFLRKTLGKRVWESDNKSERSLVYLSEIYSHSSTAVTRRYIGITDQDIKDIYVGL